MVINKKNFWNMYQALYQKQIFKMLVRQMVVTVFRSLVLIALVNPNFEAKAQRDGKNFCSHCSFILEKYNIQMFSLFNSAVSNTRPPRGSNVAHL